MNRRRPRAPNIKRVACHSDEKCKRYLRVKEADLNELTLEYMAWRNRNEGVGTTYHNAQKRIEVFLEYLAKGGYYHQVARTEGIAECTASLYLHSVATFFQQTAAQ